MKISVYLLAFLAGLIRLGLADGPAFGQGRLLLKSGFEGRFRFRDCPGFHLVTENRRYESQGQTVYHVTIEKRGNRFTYSIDGNIVLDTVDDRFNPLHDRGLMGFRTWHTDLWWDNFIVTRL